MPKNPTGSVANWNPGAGSTTPTKNSALMNTEAKDNKDSINATNELKEFVGGKGKPSGPYGLQGKEF